MDTIDRALRGLTDDERETYCVALREVVGKPGVGGYGQYLGSMAPVIFATDEQRLEALRRTNEWGKP